MYCMSNGISIMINDVNTGALIQKEERPQPYPCQPIGPAHRGHKLKFGEAESAQVSIQHFATFPPLTQ